MPLNLEQYFLCKYPASLERYLAARSLLEEKETADLADAYLSGTSYRGTCPVYDIIAGGERYQLVLNEIRAFLASGGMGE